MAVWTNMITPTTSCWKLAVLRVLVRKRPVLPSHFCIWLLVCVRIFVYAYFMCEYVCVCVPVCVRMCMYVCLYVCLRVHMASPHCIIDASFSNLFNRVFFFNISFGPIKIRWLLADCE